MTMKKIIYLVLALMFITSPVLAADKFKVGTVTFKSAVPAIDTTVITADDLTVSLAGNKSINVGTTNLIFKGLVSQIQEGADFEITTGQDVQSGKVNINGTLTQTASSGRTTVYASDEETTVESGSVTILSVTDNTFTFRYSAKVANLLKRVTNPLRGDLEGKESRLNNAVVSGHVTGSLE